VTPPFQPLWAFFRRDAAIHTSYKLGFSMDVAGVFLTAATYYFVAKLFGNSAAPFLAAYGGDYFSFVLIGIAFSTYQYVGLNSFAQSLRQEQFLNTLEPILLTPVSLTQFLAGSALWDFLYNTFQVALYFAVGMMLFGMRIPHARLLPAAALLGLTILAFMGLGVMAAAFIMLYKRGNPVTWMVTNVSSLLGGVYFPVDVLPGWLKDVAFFVPMTHALEGLRKSLLMGAGWGETASHLTALAVFVAVLWPLGIFFFAAALKKSQREGSLGHY
jgi:ABC-2 type transport system permease protein